MIKYILFIFLILTTTAQGKISLGSSILYAKQNHPTLKFKSNTDQLKLTSLNIGYIEKFEKITIGLYTNRLLNVKLKRKATDNISNFISKSKTKYNLIQIGYIKKNIMPTFFVADTILEQELYYNNIKISDQKDRVYLFGTGLNIFLDKNIVFNINYIMPSGKIYLQSGLSFGFNYLF
jgi:hypothetical protein